MKGTSSKALAFGDPEKKIGYNGNELQNKEFADGSGLESYDFNARTYDQQIGRFLQIDPKADEHGQEVLSPYHFCNNNPVLHSDPAGKCWVCKTASAGWEYTKGRLQGATNTLTAGLKMQYQVAKTAINYATSSEYRQQINTQIKQAVNDPLVLNKAIDRTLTTAIETVNNTIVAFKDPQSYTPQNCGKLVGTAEGTVLLSMGGSAGVMTNSVRNGVKVAEEITAQGLTQIKYTYTKTAAKHLTDVVQRGENAGMLARPYMRSPLTIEEIMKAGNGVPDATFKGGMNWNVSGTFRGSEGTWQLGMNPETNVIYHFNFVSK